MHVLLGALGGAVVSVVITAAVALVSGRRPTLSGLLLAAAAGALGGAVAFATLGTSAAAAGTGRTLIAFGAGGAAAGGGEQAGHNALAGRPLSEGLPQATALGAGAGVALPAAGRALGQAWSAGARALRPAGETQPVRGVVDVLLGRPAGAARGRRGRGPAVYGTVHPRAPSWLRQRFARAREAVAGGQAGPQASADDVGRFLDETYEHVREVNALLEALGGRARPLPARAAPDDLLRGVHDFGERASVRRVEGLIAELRRSPPTDRDGVALEVPEWLARLPREARAAGEATIDVGKLSPHVAAGLGRSGPPDPFAIRLHNLAPHHTTLRSGGGRVSEVLREEVADMVNAMRQPRIYRPQPMPFSRIRSILLEQVERGALPQEAVPVIRRALAAQRRLERTGAVNPYHLLERPGAPQPAAVDPRDLLPLAGAPTVSAAAEEPADLPLGSAR